MDKDEMTPSGFVIVDNRGKARVEPNTSVATPAVVVPIAPDVATVTAAEEALESARRDREHDPDQTVVKVERAFVVTCNRVSCGARMLGDKLNPGIVATCSTRDLADRGRQTHMLKHRQHDERVQQILGDRQNKDMATVVEGELETKTLDGHRETASSTQYTDAPLRTWHESDTLDWQYGSEASGRDIDKKWHYGCGGEVEEVLVQPGDDYDYLHCIRCNLWGTEDGKPPAGTRGADDE